MDPGAVRQVIRHVLDAGPRTTHEEARRIAPGPAIDLGMHDLGMELHGDRGGPVEKRLIGECAL